MYIQYHCMVIHGSYICGEPLRYVQSLCRRAETNVKLCSEVDPNKKIKNYFHPVEKQTNKSMVLSLPSCEQTTYSLKSLVLFTSKKIK